MLATRDKVLEDSLVSKLFVFPVYTYLLLDARLLVVFREKGKKHLSEERERLGIYGTIVLAFNPPN